MLNQKAESGYGARLKVAELFILCSFSYISSFDG